MKIKPFTSPPSLPPDFYDRTSSILLEATRAILRHEPLYATAGTFPALPVGTSGFPTGTDPNNRSKSPTSSLSTPHDDIIMSNERTVNKRPISREELYRSVEDLCIHKFGAKLYQQVASAINDAASESLARLSTTAGADVVKQNCGTEGMSIYYSCLSLFVRVFPSF